MFKVRNILCCLLLATGMAVPSYSGGCLSLFESEAQYSSSTQSALDNLGEADWYLEKAKKQIVDKQNDPKQSNNIEKLQERLKAIERMEWEIARLKNNIKSYHRGESLPSELGTEARNLKSKSGDLEFQSRR